MSGLTQFQDFDAAAGSFNLGLSSLGHTMSAYSKRYIDITTPQDCYRVAGIAQQTRACHTYWADFLTSLEVTELIQVDFVIFNTMDRGKTFTTLEWQAPEKRQVTTLMV